MGTDAGEAVVLVGNLGVPGASFRARRACRQGTRAKKELPRGGRSAFLAKTAMGRCGLIESIDNCQRTIDNPQMEQ
jgi:hypothetical protein